MIAYVQGYSDTDEIRNCPFCGGNIELERRRNKATCYECNRRFAVVEVEEE